MHFPHPAFVLPGSFHIGRFRIPIYGLFATGGLIAALALSQRTAKFRGLDANKLWDAGMFAVVAAFVASRALLILTHLEASITFPFLMLTMPSLTYTGMFLTAVLTSGFLRWQWLPLLATLDAWAPCAAVLAAVLQLGHYFEGTDAGMPTSLPWGVITPGDTVLGRVHPVQLYGFVVALALTEFLLIRLKRGALVGQVAAYALVLGGLASFLLDFVRQPTDSQSPLWLEPSQFVAVAAVAVGAVIWAMRPGAKARFPGDLDRGLKAPSPSGDLESLSPTLESLSPNMESPSPTLESLSPNMESPSPAPESLSPNSESFSSAQEPTNAQ